MQFRDPEFIAQSMFLNPATHSELDQGTLVPKPFSALCAVPVRCEKPSGYFYFLVLFHKN